MGVYKDYEVVAVNAKEWGYGTWIFVILAAINLFRGGDLLFVGLFLLLGYYCFTREKALKRGEGP
jgi:hypothetical protein